MMLSPPQEQPAAADNNNPSTPNIPNTPGISSLAETDKTMQSVVKGGSKAEFWIALQAWLTSKMSKEEASDVYNCFKQVYEERIGKLPEGV